MKISCCWIYAITKYGYPPSLENTYKALSDMARLGFTYAELEGVGEHNMRAVYDQRQKLKSHVDRLGLQLVNFSPILPGAVSSDQSERQKVFELFDLAVEIATLFNCSTLQVDSFTPPLEYIGDTPYQTNFGYGQHYRVKIDPAFHYPDLWEILVDSTSRCNEKAKAAGLNLLMEPRVGENIANTDALLRLMEAVGDDNFGAVLDTAHLNAQKELLPLSVEKLAGRIRYVHAADNDGRTNEHTAVGRGSVDWEGVFIALKKHHFDGYVAIDVGKVEDLDAQVLESIHYLTDLAARLMV